MNPKIKYVEIINCRSVITKTLGESTKLYFIWGEVAHGSLILIKNHFLSSILLLPNIYFLVHSHYVCFLTIDNQMMEAPTRSLDSEKKEIRIDIDPIPGHMEEKLWNRKISQLEESVLNQKAFDLPLNMSMEAKSGIVATEPALSESNTRAIKFNQTNIKVVYAGYSR